MIAVVQRASRAEVRVAGESVATIGAGLLALVAVMQGDDGADVEYLADKIQHLRVFADEDGKMNRSVLDTGGAVLLVSNFTLGGDTRRGRRPSFARAAAPALAEDLFGELARRLRQSGLPVETGRFAAMMEVDLVNDGPVTLILDSRETRRGGRREKSS